MEDNELMHGGPGSGRWPKGSTNNVPGSGGTNKKKKPKRSYDLVPAGTRPTSMKDSYEVATTGKNAVYKYFSKSGGSTRKNDDDPKVEIIDDRPNKKQTEREKETIIIDGKAEEVKSGKTNKNNGKSERKKEEPTNVDETIKEESNKNGSDKSKGSGGQPPKDPNNSNKNNNNKKNEPDVIGERLNKASQIAYQTSKGLEAADKVNTAIAKNKNHKLTQQEIDSMDNDELRKRAERIELENRYKNATKDRISKGHERVQKTLAVAIPLATVTQYSLVIAKLVREMKQGK